MYLTIIPIDKAVYVDGEAYLNLDLTTCQIPFNVHALQWYETNGHIEYIDVDTPNEIIQIIPDWALAAKAVWQVAYDENHAPPPPPTPEEIQQTNKNKAVDFLKQTDWVDLPAVSNPEVSNPYLMNVNAFLEWRSQIREVAINPPTTFVDFSTAPSAVWSS